MTALRASCHEMTAIVEAALKKTAHHPLDVALHDKSAVAAHD